MGTRQLDLCDPIQSFETIVPQRAKSYIILYQAMLALAARHLENEARHAQTFQEPPLWKRYEVTSLKLHGKCLKYILKWKAAGNAMPDEYLVAAAIILRVFEEMEGVSPKELRY